MSEEQSYEELYDKGFTDKFTDTEVLDEEEIEEEVEQPAEADEGESEETPDEVTEDDTEESDEEDSIESNEPTKLSKTIKWNGQEITLSEEEIDALLPKAFDYTKKTQDLAKHRAVIEMMNEKGLSKEDIALLADIKAGSKEALALAAKQAGIDPLDVEYNESYAPQVQERNYALNDVVDMIKRDSENGVVVDRYIASLPESHRSEFIANPEILKGLYTDTVNGISQRIMPDVIKQLVINPNQSFVDAYMAVGSKLLSDEEAADKVEQKPEASREQKKKATIVKKSKNSVINDHKDVWEDDELYEKMKRMVDPMYR